MEIGLRYNLDLVEDVSNILSNDFWVLEKFTFAMIPPIEDPVKFSSNVSVYVKKGHCNVEIDLQTYEIKAPAIVNIRKSQIIQLVSVSEDFDSSFIVLSKRFCDNLYLLLQECREYAVASRYPIVKIPEGLESKFAKFYSHLADIFNDGKDSNSYHAMILAIASFFYECGVKCYAPLNDGIPKGANRLPEKFISLAQQNFKKERFLNFYAEALDVTPKHLSRVVKGATGFTAVEWIERLVILEAKVLLKSSSLNIQQIADELNFPSQSFFGKYFKKHTGHSPKEFRNFNL